MVAGLIVRQHSFVETDLEIITTTILSLLLIQAEQFSVTGEKMSIKYMLSSRNSLDKLSDRLDVILVVDLAVKLQHNNKLYRVFILFLLSVGSIPR